MIIAILSPGPSLAKTCPSDKGLGVFDVVIAVNRAILLRPGIEDFIHWHACGDWDTILAIKTAPKTGIVTTRDAARVVQLGEQGWRYAGMKWELWEELPVAPGFSIISALALASKLTPTVVMVFGDDKQGLLDWDGTPGRERRDARWDRERSLQDHAIRKLGINVQYVKERP